MFASLFFVQVARYHGETLHEQWQGVMQPLLNAAADAAARLQQLPAVMAARQRTTDLTELSVLVVQKVEQLYREQHGQPSGYGRLATDVIRLCKAFAKFGLPVALKASAVQSPTVQLGAEDAAAASGAADVADGSEVVAKYRAAPFKGPPAFIWEILVLFVLQEHAAAGTFYHQSEPLALFMAVLKEASELLRTGDADEALIRAVVLDMSCVHKGGFTVEQALQFRKAWGSGRMHTPYIINPVDPTFNCTIMQPFRAWDATAEAAAQLHAQLVEALENSDGGGSGDVWQHVLSSTTLKPVWDTFRPAVHVGPDSSKRYNLISSSIASRRGQ
jgi:hypothetical protein